MNPESRCELLGNERLQGFTALRCSQGDKVRSSIAVMSSGVWKPSRPVVYLVALLTIWPPVYFLLFLSFIMFAFASVGGRSGKSQGIDLFTYIFPLHLLTILLMFVLTAVYVVHAFRNDDLPPDKRTLWVIVLFLGNMLAFPVYWWLYLRPTRRPEVVRQQTVLPPDD